MALFNVFSADLPWHGREVTLPRGIKQGVLMGTWGYMPLPLSPAGGGGLCTGHLAGAVCKPVSLCFYPPPQGKSQSTTVSSWSPKDPSSNLVYYFFPG